jgi:SNF2 family DNA or RNA helicase
LVSVENKVSLFTKFRQISGGTIKAEGVHLVLEEKPEKLEALLADIATHTDQAIIWAAFTHEILLLARELEKHGGVVLFYGGVDQEQREENVRIFQAGKARFFVANPGSAAFGLNLQNAHLQYVYSRHLSPAVNWQAEDRTHRAGQRSVCVYKTLVARGTVDEGIEVMLAKKTDLREAFRSMDNKAILDLCVLKTEG